MARRKTYRRYGARFLMPSEVGSSIRWGIRMYTGGKSKTTDFECDVSLSDCNRHISWGGYGSKGAKDMVRKLDAAISELQKCRDSLVELQGKVKP